MASLFAHLAFGRRQRREGFKIERPFRNLESVNRIRVGAGSKIRQHAWFTVGPECAVQIGQNVSIGRYFGLSGVGSSITIEDDVLISERVFITESYHTLPDATYPVRHQSHSIGPVHIGRGTWIGIGVAIMPGVTIGKHCVIGANSVVTHDVPPYTVAAGVPAKVIRRLDGGDDASAQGALGDQNKDND